MTARTEDACRGQGRVEILKRTAVSVHAWFRMGPFNLRCIHKIRWSHTGSLEWEEMLLNEAGRIR